MILDTFLQIEMLKFLWQLLFSTWIIDGIETLRKNVKRTEEDYNDLSKQVEKFNGTFEEIRRLNGEIEELTKIEQQLKAAWMFIHVMWKDAYHEYIEQHKTSIAKIIKAHYEKNTLTWENRDIIIQDIVEDIEKVNGSQSSEIEQYTDTVLIHFLLYNKRDDLSDLIGIDKKKITLEWKE